MDVEKIQPRQRRVINGRVYGAGTKYKTPKQREVNNGTDTQQK